MSELPEWMTVTKVDEGTIMVDGKEYVYHVLDRSLEPRLPGFLGFSGGEHLFISEEVPEDFRPYMLTHEIREFTTLAGLPGRCCVALTFELAEVPPEIYVVYLSYRLQFFRNLVAYYVESDDPKVSDLKGEIARSLQYIEGEVDRL